MTKSGEILSGYISNCRWLDSHSLPQAAEIVTGILVSITSVWNPPGAGCRALSVWVVLLSQVFDVPARRSTGRIRLLSAPEAGGQDGDTHPDLEPPLTASSLAAITNAGRRRTNQTQEPSHRSRSVSSSHMTCFRKNGREPVALPLPLALYLRCSWVRGLCLTIPLRLPLWRTDTDI